MQSEMISILQSITTHSDTSCHHNMCIIFTSSILLKNSLAKKLEANIVIRNTAHKTCF